MVEISKNEADVALDNCLESLENLEKAKRVQEKSLLLQRSYEATLAKGSQIFYRQFHIRHSMSWMFLEFHKLNRDTSRLRLDRL